MTGVGLAMPTEPVGATGSGGQLLVLNRNLVVLNLNPVVAGEIKKEIMIMIKKPED
jgi:hypothetical protein